MEKQEKISIMSRFASPREIMCLEVIVTRGNMTKVELGYDLECYTSVGDARDMGSIPGSERPPGEGNGNPPQYSCLGNPTDRGA